MNHSHAIALSVAAVSFSASAQTTVNTFAASPAAGVWGESLLTGDGTISIVDLVGAGGDLETSVPLGTGAGRLTTGVNNADRAEVAIGTSLSASLALSTGTFGYSYYKSGGTAFTAPALKLAIFSPSGTGDTFGQLIYEPTWNQPAGGSAAVPTDAWQDLSIAATDGAADDTTGGWWWTGGFGEASGAGGPPIRSLAEWNALFTANQSAEFDYANASVVGIAVGIGTFNPGLNTYFDAVSYDVPALGSASFNFEVPEPASAALLALGSLAALRRRRGAA